MVNSEEFGKRLQKIMNEYDLNATSLADAIDVGRSSISHILSGRNKPSLEFVMKVVESFPEVELYWLLNGKGDFPKKENGKASAPQPVSVRKTQEALNFEQHSRENERNTNQPEKDEVVKSKNQGSTGEIERIVLFYKDGTFKSFLP